MHRDGRRRTAPAVLLLASLALAAASAEGAQNRARLLPVRALEPGDASLAEMARQGAIARLRNPECRQVLNDFTDGRGHKLHENLQAFGVGPDEYLAMLPLLDGESRPLCKANQSQLLTSAGVRRVFVCKIFLKTVYQRRAMAEVYVIHEMLHTLGLGENPPTSQQITQKVVKRCAP
jgi:hypothetical protein